jgi:hypothetical protein
MQFTKIKDDGKRVTLHWFTKQASGTEVHHQLEGRERPREAFTAAMAAFIQPVLAVMQLKPEYADGFTVRGLSINIEEADGRVGLIATCIKTLADTNGPLVLNTPLMRERMEDDPEGGKFMPDEWLKLLETAESEAKAYLDGSREQLDLLQPAGAATDE